MLKQPSSEYRGFRAAGIRLSEEMLPQLQTLAAGRSRAMLHALHAFDKAHAVMLVEEGLLTKEAGVATKPDSSRPNAPSPSNLIRSAVGVNRTRPLIDRFTTWRALIGFSSSSAAHSSSRPCGF
jgi:hypothetical protein